MSMGIIILVVKFEVLPGKKKAFCVYFSQWIHFFGSHKMYHKEKVWQMSSSAEHLLVAFQFITCCFTLISVFVTNAFLSTASHVWNVYKDFSLCTIFSWETSRCLIPSSLESFLNNFECWDGQFRLPHT